MQTFKIENWVYTLYKAGIWSGVILSLFLSGLLVLAGFEKNSNQEDLTFSVLVLSIFIIVVGLILAWILFRGIKNLPYMSVSVDDEGLWLTHLTKKSGFIPWQDIASIRERNLWQRIDLNNSKGETLIKLEYQLSEFNKLQSIVLKNTERYINQSKIPVISSRPLIYHLVYGVCFIAFSTLVWMVGDTEPLLALVLVGIIIYIIVYEYLKVPIRVIINKDNFNIQYPLISRVHSYSEIKSVQKKIVQSGHYGTQQFTQIEILVNGSKKPHVLKGIGDELMLYQLIHTAWKNN